MYIVFQGFYVMCVSMERFHRSAWVLPSLFLSRSSRIGSSWGQEEDSGVSEAPAEIQVDSSQLPLVERADGEKAFRFYWLDAFEDPYNQPGKTYLQVMRLLP